MLEMKFFPLKMYHRVHRYAILFFTHKSFAVAHFPVPHQLKSDFQITYHLNQIAETKFDKIATPDVGN